MKFVMFMLIGIWFCKFCNCVYLKCVFFVMLVVLLVIIVGNVSYYIFYIVVFVLDDRKY